jgi:hypothetical protein
MSSKEDEYPTIELIEPESKQKNTFKLESSRLHSITPPLIEIRRSGNLKGNAIYLSPAYDWKIVKDNQGELCLICYTKPAKPEYLP